MMKILSVFLITLLFTLCLAAQTVPGGNPEALIDIATNEGAKLVNGQWKYSDTRIVETDFNAAGAEGQPTGPSVKTYDYTPHAGASDFDDSGWEKVDASDLVKRRGNGRLSFNWYRINLTIPESVNGLSTIG